MKSESNVEKQAASPSASQNEQQGKRGQSVEDLVTSNAFRPTGGSFLHGAGMRIVKQPNNQIYKAVVVVWLTLSVSSVIFAAVTWVQLSQKLAEARDAASIQDEVDGLFRLLLDTETGQRGYSLTGDESFLEPLTAGATNLPPQFDKLLRLGADDPAMLKKVMDLRAQTELMLKFTDAVIAVRKMKGIKAAADIVATREGKRIMDEIRILVAEIRGMRSHLISDGEVVARAQLTRALLTDLVTGALGIGAGVIAFWLARLTLHHQAREKELIEAKLQAERNSQEKTVFLANMSHEIRTPMNAILGFSELLAGDLYEPKHRQYLKSIRSSANSLLQLINDILDMSKVEAGVLELRPEPTDPREICNFIQTVFSEPAAKKNVKLECVVAEDLPRALLMDRIRLRQVLVNLVGNAVKFTDKGNIYIRVKWEKQKTSSHVTLLIEVQDTGVGIPKEKLEAIFKPFVQAGAHREKERTGTGLGLSIVRRLTEMMGGTVVAASVLGEGSAFSLRFPDVPISARLPISEKLELASDTNFNELRPATILAVDDNETNCELIASMFAGTHHRLFFNFTGQEAVSQASTLKPDLILMDVRMPGMDGRETLTEIRKIQGLEMTPVIAVTASSLLSGEEELKERFNGYVRKPFTKRELFDEMANFLPRQTGLVHLDTAGKTAGKTAEAQDASVEQNIAVSPELVNELRKLMQNDWPPVRDGLAINECKAFAAKLESVARQWQCQPLLTYSKKVLSDAENYAVTDLERHILEFSAVVEKIEQAGK